jgi:hypothetical protein
MFKKKCPHCHEKIQKNYGFCPSCGENLTKKEDYGILGKNDAEEFIPDTFGSPMIDKLFKTAEKMVSNMMEKQMKGISNQRKQNPNNPNQQNPFGNMRVQFYVNGKKVNVDPQQKQNNQNQKQNNQPRPVQQLSPEKAELFAKLPRKEPKTIMKRLSGKLIYELEVPGVKDISDVLINQLENSIEVKALAKTKVYSKTLNVNLPIIGYTLNKSNLIVELQAK